MNSEQTQIQQPSRQDHALLRSAVFKLSASRRIIVAVVIVAVVLAWYDLLNRMLAFGDGIDYAGLHVVGAEATALLQQYNPFFWWAVVALCTIIIAYFLYLFARASMRQARLRPVDAMTFARLSDGLSLPALDVLLWAWRDRDEPLSVGDLQRAREALAADRAGKLQRATQQLAILQDARKIR
ncbi:MAG TPA: hypothetical protein VL024_06105 [Castellaniella sp.]|nr:hypothetical protein [Castellaniella sp.]